MRLCRCEALFRGGDGDNDFEFSFLEATSTTREKRSRLRSTSIAEALLGDGVVTEPGAPFFDRFEGPCPFFRLGYSSIASEQIAEGVARIAKTVRRLRPMAFEPGRTGS